MFRRGLCPLRFADPRDGFVQGNSTWAGCSLGKRGRVFRQMTDIPRRPLTCPIVPTRAKSLKAAAARPLRASGLDPFRALRGAGRRRRVEEQAFTAPIKEHDKKGLAESSVKQ